jgi:pimeloyl-ACP methyl ester carboxylesterase
MIDLRCHGRSAKLHDPESASLRLMAEDVIRVLDALGLDKAHYWGHSLGGIVGYYAAAFAPDRLRSLVLGGAHPFAQSGEGLRRIFGSENPAAAIVGALEMDSMSPQFKGIVEDNDFQALCATVAIDRPDISDVLPHLTMPCLVYVGDAEERFEGANESASHIPNANFFSLPGLNHLEGLTRSALVIHRVKQFLAEMSQH